MGNQKKILSDKSPSSRKTLKDKKTTTDKGNILEDALEALEKILISAYVIPEKSIIETSTKYKYRLPGGALREVDVLIKVRDGEDFERIYIYECKNWERKVTPVEVSYFQKKVEEVGAMYGTIVGKHFTKGALAEIARDKRLKYAKATDLSIDPNDLFVNVEYFGHSSPVQYQLEFIANDDSILVPPPTNMYENPDGSLINQEQFVEMIFGFENQINHQIQKIKNSRTEGHSDVDIVSIKEIVPPDFFMHAGISIKKIWVRLKFRYYYAIAKRISHFDIETRGRIGHLEIRDHDNRIIPIHTLNM